MAPLRAISDWFSRLIHRRPAEVKPAWGRQSPIELLADTLVTSPQGWLLEAHAIRRNGVVISWRGSLNDARTAVKVTMDKQRFRITAAESKLLRDRVITLLDQGDTPG
jgi:hypothetical protein